MKKLLFCLLLITNSCALVSTRSGFALVSEIKEPEPTVEFSSNYGKYSRRGESCARNILGIYAFGDLTIEAAKKNGNITKITSISQTKNNMVFASKVCTVVKGY
jgi:hypothetical protein